MTKHYCGAVEAVATAGLLLTALVAPVGCDHGDEAPAPTPATHQSTSATPPALTDTSWQLIDFTSMDDATGVRKPEDPSRYTMQLDADGTVKFQLHCNRATGTWQAEPAADGMSGTVRFGPLAATSALCSPPSMDELVTAQAPYVRGYLLKDGKLYLSLMADGGILAWEPHDRQPASNPP